MKLVLSLFVNDPAEEDADDVGWCSHVGHEIKFATIAGVTENVTRMFRKGMLLSPILF